MSKQCAEGHVWESGEAVCNRCGGVDIYEQPVQNLTETERETVEENTQEAPAEEVVVEAEPVAEVAVEETVAAPAEEVPTIEEQVLS